MLDVTRGLGAAVLSVAMLAIFPSDVSAQMPTELRDGRRALSMGLLADSGATVGFSLMLTSRTALTIDVSGDASLFGQETEDEETDQFVAQAFLAPGFRHYMAGRGDVASYVAARALLGLQSMVRETTDSGGETFRSEMWAPSAGAALGFGLEWFVTDAMSLRAEAVVDGTYLSSRTENGGAEQTTHSMRAGLGQSVLTVSILF